MSRTARAAARTDYDVGYGKPPVHTRFKKGQSGNPSGRPRKSNGTSLLEHAKELALKEAYRPVTVREGGKVMRIPGLQAVMRSQITLAAKGNGPAQRAVIKAVQELESEYEARKQAVVDGWMEYKISAKRKIEDRRRRGLPTDDIKPHPEDILVDVGAGEVWVRQGLWQDDAAKIRELGLGGIPKLEQPAPANDDSHSGLSERAVVQVPLGNVLGPLGFEAREAVIEAYHEARASEPVTSESVGLNGDAVREVQVDPAAPHDAAPSEDKACKRRRPVQLADILKRLEPEFRGQLRRAYDDGERAIARLLQDVPRPWPTFAGMPAEHAAALVTLYTPDLLRELSESANSAMLSEGLKQRARSILDKRLAQLRALHADPNLPRTMQAAVGEALQARLSRIPLAVTRR